MRASDFAVAPKDPNPLRGTGPGGMDSSGKERLTKHVLSGLNPRGVEVSSFRRPTEEEALHDYLWRCAKRLPERGRIGIFHRSHYEEALVVRVRPNPLSAEGARRRAATPAFRSDRYEEISAFERLDGLKLRYPEPGGERGGNGQSEGDLEA